MQAVILVAVVTELKQSQLLLRPTKIELGLQVWSEVWPVRSYTTLAVFVYLFILVSISSTVITLDPLTGSSSKGHFWQNHYVVIFCLVVTGRQVDG